MVDPLNPLAHQQQISRSNPLDTGNVIRPLILEESSNDAEALASSLRNAGFAVRYRHIEDNEDLQSALDEQAWDILLAASQVGDYRALDAIATIKRAGKDIPCIVFGPQGDNDSIVAMLKAGAADYINEEAQDHLLLVITREISNLHERRAHRQCKNLYAESEKRNRVLLDSSRDPVAYLHEGMHVYVNQSYLDIFGYVDRDELESVPVMDMIAPNEQQKFKDVLRTLGHGETPEGTLEFNVVHADGDEFQATMQFSPASVDGEPCTQIMIHQKSHSKELEKELQQLRQQDLLTGLFNHQHFMEELKVTLASATADECHGTLLYLEPSDFKTIKETLGIAGSDLVLADIAQLLRDNSPDDAILARYAGTVFTIILNNSNSAQAEELAEQLRQALADKIFDIEEKSVTTTFSIGVAPIHETTQDTKQVLGHAEQACGIARERGGNRIHSFSEEDALAVLQADKKMIALLQIALKNNRF
ncbi:MAG TPA: diguanylate cyclase, partial [Chromatiales bacterium]|nr:diguanylate cyclase [Chromatiales bacterium]HEX22185.1 diguanylate cyclase [Chromatiales bacterium]